MATTLKTGARQFGQASDNRPRPTNIQGPTLSQLSSGLQLRRLTETNLINAVENTLNDSLSNPREKLASLRQQFRQNTEVDSLRVVVEDLLSKPASSDEDDDAAGIKFSSGLKASVRKLVQGEKNIQDGISLLSTVDSAVTELTKIVRDLKKLSEQAVRTDIERSQREALNTEAQALKAEYARVIQTTEFNGTRVLTNGFQGVSLQTSDGQGGIITSSLGGAVGTGGFQPQGSFSGFNLFPGTTGDFNGDGALDQAVTDASSNSIKVQLGDGQGNFASSTLFAAGSGPQSVASGDFNGDGILDLATANPSSNTISVIIGDGSGSFSSPSSFATGASPQMIASGDINGDGALDLAVTNQNDSSISILLGDRTGGFNAQTTLATSSSPNLVALADLNQDNFLDLINNEASGATVAISFGDGSGGFVRSGTITPYETSFSSLLTGDFNNDGAPDLATLGVFDGSIEVALNNGSGTFTDTIYTATSDLLSVSGQTGDFNGDGFLDIAHSNFPGNIKIWTGDGTGNFSMENTYSSQGSPTSVGDFNNDGVLDIATSTDILTGNTATGTAPLLDFSLNTISDAKQALTQFTDKLDQLSIQQGSVIALQSRLTSTSRIIQASADFLSTGIKQIENIADARNTALGTKQSIIREASRALLAQAPTSPAIALSLLS